MNVFKTIAAVACTALCAYSFAVNALDVNAPEKDKPTMQRYIFKYNFNKSVDPVRKMMKHTQQQVQYEVAMDVLTSAHGTLNTTYDELSVMVNNQQNKQQAEQSNLAE